MIRFGLLCWFGLFPADLLDEIFVSFFFFLGLCYRLAATSPSVIRLETKWTIRWRVCDIWNQPHLEEQKEFQTTGTPFIVYLSLCPNPVWQTEF